MTGDMLVGPHQHQPAAVAAHPRPREPHSLSTAGPRTRAAFSNAAAAFRRRRTIRRESGPGIRRKSAMPSRSITRGRARRSVERRVRAQRSVGGRAAGRRGASFVALAERPDPTVRYCGRFRRMMRTRIFPVDALRVAPRSSKSRRHHRRPSTWCIGRRAASAVAERPPLGCVGYNKARPGQPDGRRAILPATDSSRADTGVTSRPAACREQMLPALAAETTGQPGKAPPPAREPVQGRPDRR